jgi:hypothetical protein
LSIRIVRVAWVSRHRLTEEQHTLLQQVYGDHIAVTQYRRTFETPGECVLFVKSLTDQGLEVYMSPLPIEMQNALKEAGLEWSFFNGYQASPGQYQALGITKCVGSSASLVLRLN